MWTPLVMFEHLFLKRMECSLISSWFVFLVNLASHSGGLSESKFPSTFDWWLINPFFIMRAALLWADWHCRCLCVSSVSLSHGSWRVERSVRLRRESTWVKLSWRMASSIMVREGSPLKKIVLIPWFVEHGPWYYNSVILNFCRVLWYISKYHNCNICS